MAYRDGDAWVFRGWTGGEYGDLDAVVAGRNPRQMFSALNMVLYTSGLIGPRAGLVDAGLASAPSLSAGDIEGMGTVAVGETTGRGPWFWLAANGYFYQAQLGTGTSPTTPAFSGAYTGTPSPLTSVTRPIPQGGSFGAGDILNVYEKGVYELAHGSTKTIDTVHSSTDYGGGSVIGFADTRFVLNGSDGAKATGDSRLYYSNVFPGWDAFGSTEYYDFGAIEVTMIRPFRDGFIVGNNAGEFWYATGVIGTSLTIRRLSRGGAPAFESRGTILKGNQAVYMDPNVSYPSTFDGAVHDPLKHLAFTGDTAADDDGTSPGFRVMPMPWGGADDYAILSGQTGSGAANRALMFHNGVHTFHEFEQTTSAHAVCLGEAAATNSNDSPYYAIASDDGADDYWLWAPAPPGLDTRPGFTSDSLNGPGDNSSSCFSTCYLHTPIELVPEGGRVRIVKVIVDYIGWDTGATDSVVAFDLTVDAVLRYDGDSGSSSSTLSFSSADSNFATTGTRKRAEFSVGDQGAGGGFQVKLDNIKACAIEQIIVVPEREPNRP